MAMKMTFEEVTDTVRELSPEQQAILANLMHGWQIEAVRHEIAEDAKESLNAFHKGQFKAQSAKAVIKELREYVREPE